MPVDSSSSSATSEGNWTQHEELHDWTQDVVQHRKERTAKLPKVTNSVVRDGWVSLGVEGGFP